MIMMDDDVICDVFEPPATGKNVAFSDDSREARFYSTDDEWQQYQGTSSRDPVARHLQCLGLTVPEALGALGIKSVTQRHFDNIPNWFASSLGSNSRILVTQCGSYGDPGTGNNHWLIELIDDSRADLLKSEASVEMALNQRNSWNGRTSPTIVPQSDISQISGFDNRELLPPYFPLFRFDDRLFGYMTRCLQPDSTSLYYDWSIPHRPIQQRGWTEDENNYYLSSGFPDFFLKYVDFYATEQESTNPLERYDGIADVFSELSQFETDKLMGLQAEYFEREKADYQTKITNSLRDSFHAPSGWQQYLNRANKQIQASGAPISSVELLAGTPGYLNGEGLVEFWRTAWEEFGQGIRGWPEIRRAAREIMADSDTF